MIGGDEDEDEDGDGADHHQDMLDAIFLTLKRLHGWMSLLCNDCTFLNRFRFQR